MIRWLAPVAAILLLWQGVVSITGLPPYILPSPLRVAAAIRDNAALLTSHALVTLGEIVVALVLGAVLGAATAVGLALSPPLRRITEPMLVLSQAIPVFALAPIFTLWFGYGMQSKIAVALIVVYFPVTASFLDALLRTPPPLLRLAGVMQARRWTRMRCVQIPAALPGLLSGLKIAAVYAPIGAVIGEWVGASRGLGYLMLLANGRARTDLMFAAVLLIAVIAVALHLATGWAARRVLERQER